MVWMKPPFMRLSKSASSQPCEMASLRIRVECYTWYFNWPEATSFTKELMRNFRTSFLCFLLIVFSSLLVVAQDPNPAPAPPPSNSSAASTLSFNDTIDKVVEREHFFVAQMLHLHPLVETYIQN